jgi:splicing factor 3B subunit 3
LESDEAAFTVASVQFRGRGSEEFVVIGTAVKLSLSPMRHAGGRVRVYRYVPAQQKLLLMHVTEIEAPPLALCAFDGNLLVGAGTTLRLYSMGRKRLLRKCERRNLPTAIRTLDVHGDRICVGDLRESFCFVKYTRDRNELHVFADDTTPRYVTTAALLDYQTVAGGDKFGNLFVLRLPETLTDDGTAVSGSSNASASSNNSTEQMLWDANPVFGAANKLKQMNQYHVGDVVTTLKKTSLSAVRCYVVRLSCCLCYVFPLSNCFLFLTSLFFIMLYFCYLLFFGSLL